MQKKTISTALTPATIAAVTALLAATPTALDAVGQRFPAAHLRQPLRPGARSPVEIVAHLLHCEARTTEAITLALLVDEPLVPNIHPERQLGKLLRYEQHDFADLLAYFRFRRGVWLRVLTSLTPAQWARTVREEGKKRQESVYWRARALALHEQEHLREMGWAGGD